MHITRTRAAEAAAPTNAALYVPLSTLVLLALALFFLGWPTAGALVALLGCAYAGAWFVVAALSAPPGA